MHVRHKAYAKQEVNIFMHVCVHPLIVDGFPLQVVGISLMLF